MSDTMTIRIQVDKWHYAWLRIQLRLLGSRIGAFLILRTLGRERALAWIFRRVNRNIHKMIQISGEAA